MTTNEADDATGRRIAIDNHDADGDGPFWGQTLSWGHFDDPDHDALLDECKHNALHDPAAALDVLRHNVREHSRAKTRLTEGQD